MTETTPTEPAEPTDPDEAKPDATTSVPEPAPHEQDQPRGGFIKPA